MQNRIISAISVLLYIISFIGFIENISKESKVKVKYFERHNININIIKIIILSILSSILLLGVQATTSAFIVLLDYLIIATIKLVQMNKKKKIATLWCFSIIVVMAFIIIANGLGYLKINSLFLSFMPEIDANGGGAQVIQQNDIIDSANLFGKVENIGEDIILTFNSEGEIYPLIVVLANYGWVVCAIMIAIILAFNAILIFDAIKIKDRYGKLLIIGISCLFIIRSLCCLLMNLNLGIKAKFDIPFISCNKSNLVIDVISLALVFSVYRRKDINVYSKKDNEEIDTRNFSNK
jgi:cell division protein FtsW (lipid II flippase)